MKKIFHSRLPTVFILKLENSSQQSSLVQNNAGFFKIYVSIYDFRISQSDLQHDTENKFSDLSKIYLRVEILRNDHIVGYYHISSHIIMI